MTATEHGVDQLHNLAHCAAIWLERVDAPADALVMVNVLPDAGIGWFRPGEATMRRVALDDPGIEVCEAAAPLVDAALARLPAGSRIAALEAVRGGARLQLVVAPALGAALLRLTGNGRAVELLRVALRDVGETPAGALH